MKNVPKTLFQSIPVRQKHTPPPPNGCTCFIHCHLNRFLSFSIYALFCSCEDAGCCLNSGITLLANIIEVLLYLLISSALQLVIIYCQVLDSNLDTCQLGKLLIPHNMRADLNMLNPMTLSLFRTNMKHRNDLSAISSIGYWPELYNNVKM